MFKKGIYIFWGCVFTMTNIAVAQVETNKPDTFFLAKKKGLLGRLGKSIATNPPDEAPQRVENPFLKYKGKIIRSVELVRLSFQRNIYDTNLVKYNLGVRLANAFHKNSREKIIRNNLFFKEGSRLYPYLVADNERYLRDLGFIQDARIIVDFAEDNTDSVDVVVITKDIFSLGGKLKIDSRTRGRVDLQEENIAGTGNKILMSAFYDELRHPQKALSAEMTKRNIGGSFINWTTGYSNFAPSFSSGQKEEMQFFTRLEKPLVTPFIPTTGILETGYFKTSNAYIPDSLYRASTKYAYYNIDGWLGYSLDSRRRLYANREIRIHKFVNLRALTRHFITVPIKNKDTFDYRFSNSMGVLTSINVFKQIFYKTNFIYGFGRNEDVPEGFSIVLTAGYLVQQNKAYTIKGKIKRPYTSIDFGLGNFKQKGFYSNYTFRLGGYFFRNRFEDISLLFNIEHFSKLKKISSTWYRRTFITTGFASEINSVFNAPLFLNSIYGLPYFNPENIAADFRSTLKLESVYYNTTKILGFRFAPFVFTDFSLLKPVKKSFSKSDLFSAIGGGVRTRNENMVFGTVELKGYYFPRTNGDMRGWKVELNTNIRFKYNSTFIKRPDFVTAL